MRKQTAAEELEAEESPPQFNSADDAGSADGADDASGRKSILLVEKGDLPRVAEKLRDIFSERKEFFERGTPVRIVQKEGEALPTAVPMNTHSVVRAAHQICRPVHDGKNNYGENATLPDRVAAIYLN